MREPIYFQMCSRVDAEATCASGLGRFPGRLPVHHLLTNLLADFPVCVLRSDSYEYLYTVSTLQPDGVRVIDANFTNTHLFTTAVGGLSTDCTIAREPSVAKTDLHAAVARWIPG